VLTSTDESNDVIGERWIRPGVPLLVGVVLAQGATPVRGHLQSVAAPGRVAEIGAYLTDLDRLGFSGVVLVAQHDTVVVVRAGGWANREQAVPNEVSTAFSLGSLSKQFTATAILRLEMAGRVRTTDSLKRFFPDVPADKSSITLDQLLTHQAGVASSAGGRACLTRDQAVRAIFDTPLHFDPGMDYEYSNAGYNLLAAIVEVASGESFETFVHQDLWARAGLEQTGFVSDSGLWAPARVAQGYNVTAPTTPYAPRCQWNRKGSGAVISTVRDLLAWQLAVEHGLILDQPRREKLYKPRVATHEDTGADYAYGWFVGRTPAGGRVVFHGGDLLPDGFNTEFSRYLDDGITVIILSNLTVDAWGAQRNPVQTGLEAILFGGLYGRPPSTGASRDRGLVASRYEGIYQARTGLRFVIAAEPAGLAIGAEGQSAIEALVWPPASHWDEAKARKFNDLAAKVVTLAASQDAQALGQALGDTTLGLRVMRLWAELAGAKGRLLQTDVMGSVMIGDGDGPATYLRAAFAHDTTVYRVWWDWDGGFLSIHKGVDLPARHILYPLTDRDFLGWDMFNNHTIRLHFDLGAQNQARALTVETPSGSVSAERIGHGARP